MPRRISPSIPIAVAIAAVSLGGCLSTSERAAVPEAAVNLAVIQGYDDIRLWADDKLSRSERDAWRALFLDAAKRRNSARADYLVVSGGGGDGAFGAGFLTGWSATGTRPEFDIVTGISIGALVAPFAYLGPAYDGRLREMFSNYSGYDFYARDNIEKVITGQLSSEDNPLRKDIEARIDDGLLDAIATEYKRGRLLFVGTTNLDAQRTVMWNLGAIAASGRADRRALFVDVLLAAASIPVVLPAVPIRVTAKGRTFEELHVDAGTQTEAFFAPPQVSLRDIDRALGRRRSHALYIIRNDKLAPQYEKIDDGAFNVARRSLSTLLKAHAVADLYRIHAIARRDGIAYNLAEIPADAPNGEFDPRHLKRIFTLGEKLARNGYSWSRQPPGLQAAKR